MRIDHDVHVHTVLSDCCHDAEATAANVLARAARVGLRTIGFADHLWDAAVPGASDWYRPQTLERILALRRALPAEVDGVRVLVGCETEYLGGGRVGISPAAAAQLDFVLVPASHFHMKGYVVPADLARPEDVACLLVERFNEAVALGLATGIAHPFLPNGFGDRIDEILACIGDAALEDAFGRAADAGTSIEVHLGMFPGARGQRVAGHRDETFLRVLGRAKAAGCRFHFTSDAHRLDEVGQVRLLEPYARRLGLAEADVCPRFRAP